MAVVMKATLRSERGTRKVRPLRKKGLIPAVIYGHGEEALSLTLAEHDMELAIHHGERLLEVQLDGKTINVLIKDVQYDTFGTEIIHVDFLRVAMDEVIRVSVPVELRGHAKGEQHGGVTEQLLTEVAIECLPGDLPESIPLVVTDLDVGDSIHVSGLEPPAKVKITSNETLLVVTVAVARAAVAAGDEAPGEAVEVEEEPEVIARGKGEEDQAPDEKKAG